MEKKTVPFDTIHIKHIGPFVKSKKKNMYIVTSQPRTSKSALDQVIAILGVPRRIICDRGKAFESQRMKDYCDDLGIKLIPNAVATPRSNGQCEKFNDTVLSDLATSSAGRPEQNWDQYVKKVQSAINCTTYRITRKTPLQSLYEPKSHADAALLKSIQECLDDVD